MARTLKFTVDREPIDIEIGGEQFTAPPLLAPQALAELIDKQTEVQEAFGRVSQQAASGESGAIDTVMNIVSGIFDTVLVAESAERFRTRLHSRDNSFDLIREVIPAITALVEEYTGRPTQPSPPSSNGSTDGGTSSTGGALPTTSTPFALPQTASAT